MEDVEGEEEKQKERKKISTKEYKGRTTDINSPTGSNEAFRVALLLL